MTDIIMSMKDGSKREFLHRPRPGGSYDLSIAYVEGFVIVTDEYGNQKAIPSADIAEISVQPDRRW